MSDSNIDTGSWKAWHSEDIPLRLGISACLLGEPVRYNGGHKRDRFLSDTLGPWVEWVPVCPEVDVGMGIPRPTIRLVDDGDGPRLVEPASGKDYTDAMNEYSKVKLREIDVANLDGYVLKRASPSCGMQRVKVYRNDGLLHTKGVGTFAARLQETAPNLPTEEEGRLNDDLLRENFIERVFCRNRWRNLVQKPRTRRRLVAFHTAHKLLLWAHNEAGMRRLGRLVAGAGTMPDRELFARYEEELQQVMKTKATRKRHTNVLQHALGYLKRVLEPAEKREILTAVEDYRHGLLPLIVPVTLIRYNVRRHEIDYLLGQLYFDPHPKELLLRNHV